MQAQKQGALTNRNYICRVVYLHLTVSVLLTIQGQGAPAQHDMGFLLASVQLAMRVTQGGCCVAGEFDAADGEVHQGLC